LALARVGGVVVGRAVDERLIASRDEAAVVDEGSATGRMARSRLLFEPMEEDWADLSGMV
jgi:hypothetical protein